MPRKRRKTTATGTVQREQAMPATPEYGQHHDVDARPDRAGGVAGWRVRTRLDKLLADGRIGVAEWQAGATYRTAIEHGEMGGQIGGGPGSGDGCPTTARLLALRRLHEARMILSAAQRRAVDGVAVDAHWAEVARQLQCSDKTVVLHAIEGLALLADHYKLRGKGSKILSLVGA